MGKGRTRSRSQRDFTKFSDKSCDSSFTNERLCIDGGIYIGQTESGKRCGIGKMTHESCTFEGEWKDDEPHGYGIKAFLYTGDCHEGYYISGQRVGWGLYLWANGDKYIGNWLNGCMHGKGVFTWACGDVYSGEWIGGQITGVGCKTHRIEGFIEGSFVSGKMHGWVKRELVCGDVYEGQYVEDRRHGWGKYRWADGSSYVGFWKEDMLDGDGVFLNDCVAANLRLVDVNSNNMMVKYKGGFMRSLRHGYGEAKYRNGDVYQGQWVENRRHGYGRMVYHALNLIYEGQFIDDQRQGRGSLMSTSFKPAPLSSTQLIPATPSHSKLQELYDIVMSIIVNNAGDGVNNDYLTHVVVSIAEEDSIEDAVLTTYAQYHGAWHRDRPIGNGMLSLSNGDVIYGSVDKNGLFIRLND